MSQAILTALKALDVKNDNHWTADGQPRLDTVKMLAADQSLTRDIVSTAAPGFLRSNAETYQPPANDDSGTVQPPPSAAGDSSSSRDDGAPAPEQPKGDEPALEQVGPAVVNGDGETEQPEVEDRPSTGYDEIEALEEEIEEQAEEVARLRTLRDRVNKSFDEARAEEDELRTRLEQLRPKSSDADAIQDYLRAQKDKLAARAARQQMIRESGLDLNELAAGLKSPLDSAMARKTGRGGSRPVRN